MTKTSQQHVVRVRYSIYRASVVWRTYNVICAALVFALAGASATAFAAPRRHWYSRGHHLPHPPAPPHPAPPPAAICPAQIQVDFACDAIGVRSTSELEQVLLEFDGGGTQRLVLTGHSSRQTLRGSGRNAHRRISGVWVKSGCNRNRPGTRCDPNLGQHFAADSDSCGELAPVVMPTGYELVVDPRVDAGYDIAEYELNGQLAYVHVSTLEDFEGETLGVADGLITVMVHSEAELQRFLVEAHAVLAGRIDELDEAGRPEIHAITKIDLTWWQARVSTRSVVAQLSQIEPDGGNRLSVSSTTLLATIGASTTLFLAGWQVGTEFQMEGASVLNGSTNDRSSNLFTVREYELLLPMPPVSAQIPNYGVAEAWRTLEASGITRGVANLYVVDKGFFETEDLRGIWLNPQLVPYNGWGDESYEDDKPWHGTWVAHTLFGAVDNDWGFGGAVGPYPTYLKNIIATGYGPWLAHLSMSRHIDESSRSVFNMSFGAKIPIPFTFWANNLKRFTDKHFSSGRALFVASAGNDGNDVDKTWLGVEWRLYTPCELDGVTCVGGVNRDLVTRATKATTLDEDSQSNFGAHDVDLFGPYFVVDSVALDPDTATGDATFGVQGTSFAAPFVSGCAAVIWDALGTSANSKDVLRVLRDTAMQSNDRTVGRKVVQPFLAIQQILGNTAAIITVTQTPGTSRNIASATASAFDVEDGPIAASSITWTFDPGLPTQSVQTGASFSITLPDAAPHSVRVTVQDSGGLLASRTVPLQLVNSPPDVSIQNPVDGAIIERGTVQNLFAFAFDPDVDPFTIVWTVGGVGTFTGGNSINVDTSTWSLGEHFISASGTDSFGATTVSTIVIQIQDSNLPIITVAPHSAVIDYFRSPDGAFANLSASATFAGQPLPGSAISWTLPDGSVISGASLSAFVSDSWFYYIDSIARFDVTVSATEPGGATSSQVVSFFVVEIE